MAIDPTQFDTLLSDIQELKRIVSLPGMAEMLERLIHNNSGSPRSAAPPAHAPSTATTTTRSGSTASSEEPAWGKDEQLGVTETIRKVCASFGRGFTKREIRTKMEELGFVFTAKNPDEAITAVVRRMCTTGELVVIRAYSGRKANVFQYHGRAKAPAEQSLGQ